MRSQALVLLLISCLFVKFAQSQSDELLVQGQTGNLSLQHTVVAKENWYSIGRLYNISPKLIAPFNKLTMAKPLSIGQEILIPLSPVNFSQNGQKAPAEVLIPVYHIVQDKEWMYRVSVNHNKVPIPTLEKWNNINKDQVKTGMHLIVGYLKVNKAQSALASNVGRAPSAGGTQTSVAAAKTPSDKTNADKTNVDRSVEDRVEAPKPAIEKSATDRLATDKAMAEKAASDKVAQDKAAEKAAQEKITQARAAQDKTVTDKMAVEKATHVLPPPTVETKTTTPPAETRATPPVATPPTTAAPAVNFKGGYFKVDYVDGGKSIGGNAGVFKSTSGWQDGKYYALMNNIAIGTIVKVTVASSNKTIYAKILGQLPDMKESVGLTVRVSNAAASELGQSGDGRFNVEVKY